MNTYLLFKSIHLIAVISWMAGLLYLPRIFVYHSENIENVNSSNIFKTMEKKLFYYIMTPAMILSWIFGLLLIHVVGFSVFEGRGPRICHNPSVNFSASSQQFSPSKW